MTQWQYLKVNENIFLHVFERVSSFFVININFFVSFLNAKFLNIISYLQIWSVFNSLSQCEETQIFTIKA